MNDANLTLETVPLLAPAQKLLAPLLAERERALEHLTVVDHQIQNTVLALSVGMGLDPETHTVSLTEDGTRLLVLPRSEG